MESLKDNVIARKSYEFALEIVKTYKKLIDKKEFVLSKQLLRCGTSIGANVHETVASESKKDFVHKLGIAVKEARKCVYWLNLLKDGDFMDENDFCILNDACTQIIKILNSIILTTKARYKI